MCESLDEKDSGMSRSNARAFSNDIEFDAEKGVEYKVVVTVFADDGSERDTRTRTFYVTGKEKSSLVRQGAPLPRLSFFWPELLGWQMNCASMDAL